MSQEDCIGSGNRVQKQKKGPWPLGKGMPEVTHLGGRRGSRERHRPTSGGFCLFVLPCLEWYHFRVVTLMNLG